MNAASFHQGLHCLLRLKQSSGTETRNYLENSTRDPLKYTMGSPILIVSICMGKSIRIKGLMGPTVYKFGLVKYSFTKIDF